MHPDEARRCAEAGAAGIAVSNDRRHGGRASGHGVDIVLDSGIRHGGDVVIALAQGATAVSIGRPWAWALAAGGAAGIADALELLAQEIRDVMALAGLPRHRGPPPRRPTDPLDTVKRPRRRRACFDAAMRPASANRSRPPAGTPGAYGESPNIVVSDKISLNPCSFLQ
ncbi:alpha-hydroxy-acid oxidizing protein [Nguyenibacter sp. L1]|uniref:alpha-hydroxy-acid oxidizing protein n=1 Tax=Nguyenibacter sp. L1 TaxID=3049350 RepID=UPI002B45EA15|nr:alpha-hydroxy-acid oxidizing protein [Nguyenibacter sp. L1]WRH86750.1 alpha-hydroxy-acid oxidizing protein [Nguyenibacter sp. L1]